MFWSTLTFAAGVTLPACVMMLAGVGFKRWGVIKDIVKNPLIMGVFCGLAFALSGLEMPQIAENVIRYFYSEVLQPDLNFVEP